MRLAASSRLLRSLVPAVMLSACSAGSGSNETSVNHTALAVDLLAAAGGDLRIVEASGGDLEKAKLLAAGKKMAQPVLAAAPSPVASPAAKKAACWNPPSGPNIIDDPDRPIRMDELKEIEESTGRDYISGDTIWGRVEDRCPA